MLSRRTMLTTGVGVATGVAIAACSDGKSKGTGAGAAGDPSGGAGGGGAQPATVTVTPAADAKDVLPGSPVTVAIDNGTLESVTVSGGGKNVDGKLSDDKKQWASSGNLGYGQTYTVTVTGTDAAGAAVNQTSTFTTLKPTNTASITFQANPMAALKNGGTYGVGQPVIVYFNKAVKNKDAAEQAMTVTTEPAVEGKWHWVSGQSAHWRPAKYWAKGTTVKVSVKLLGVDLGNGLYGGGNSSASFTIGPSRIAIADSKTHQMECYIDGQMVRRIPVSMGKGGGTRTGSNGEKIDFLTMSGVHVLMTKEPLVTMSSASYGITDKNHPDYYEEKIRLACRISLSGEYVHMADWNIPQQGKANTSHGCINVGPANAQWFYDTFGTGDVVEVRNTGKNLPLTDGLGDWNVPFAQW
ncbi:Ig-like domain-containing protein [Dactylosporangium fulvum]|uniref:Ig-like domain-containing protein n=1 Tax=Dactylosporangium fulvum TaxID=53359 RepID=A0ABY5VQB6_9ACTN|nr:Ig-like domain-containing protein [Dactylosporangium fulvum]UWP79370.1 Ig-like domain-containing protein [Dactylosporangium fulvum]